MPMGLEAQTRATETLAGLKRTVGHVLAGAGKKFGPALETAELCGVPLAVVGLYSDVHGMGLSLGMLGFCAGGLGRLGVEAVRDAGNCAKVARSFVRPESKHGSDNGVTEDLANTSPTLAAELAAQEVPTVAVSREANQEPKNLRAALNKMKSHSKVGASHNRGASRAQNGKADNKKAPVSSSHNLPTFTS
ncbi:MAG: hypothetical protein P4M13_08750 [Alphaproteobacteria bacterium]|nr:hypothetical protein [Alphaproteobacteria bacterium]